MIATTRGRDIPRDEALAWFGRIVSETDLVFAACGLALEVDWAKVIAVPESRLLVEGNLPGAWGGEAPAGEDPDAFNYALGERLPDPIRELFAFARLGAADRTIAVVVVDEIRYWVAGELARAGGLSYPPVVYHHRDDFPARNGVFVATGYSQCGGLPIFPHPRVVAHELGHMLLDTGQHRAEDDALMSPMLGSSLTESECRTMRTELERLYGESPLVDPGPPPPK